MDDNNDDDCAPPLMILDYRSARQEVGMNINTLSLSLEERVLSAECIKAGQIRPSRHFIGEVVGRAAESTAFSQHFCAIFGKTAGSDGQQQKIHIVRHLVGCSWMEAEIREEIQA